MERMKAARVERQEQAEGERKREIEDGGVRRREEVSPHWDGTTCVASFAGRLCGVHKAAPGGGQGHRGSPASGE